MFRLVLIAIALMTTSCSDASSGCSKEETLKLIGAGYTKTEISGLCNQAEKRESTNQKSSVVEGQSESGPSPDELFSKFKGLAEYSSDDLLMDYDFNECNLSIFKIISYQSFSLKDYSSSSAHFLNLKNIDVDKSVFSTLDTRVVFPRGYYGGYISINGLRLELENGSMLETNQSVLRYYKRTVKQVLGLKEVKDYKGLEDKTIYKENILFPSLKNKIDLSRSLRLHAGFYNGRRTLLVPDVYKEDASEIINALKELVEACAKSPRSSQSQTSTKSKPSGSQVADHTKGTKRFSKDKTTGVITDLRRGLEWMIGPDKDTDYYEAQKWIASLGKGWRMPTTNELRKLLQIGLDKINIYPVFQVTRPDVWTGPIDSKWARYCNIAPKFFECDQTLREYSKAMRVLAVRSRPNG